MSTLFIVLIFIILILLPVMFGIIEIFKPRDATPMFIDMDNTKDPRYFGKSFRHIMENALKNKELRPGIMDVKLSKKETLEITDTKKVYAGEEGRHIYYVMGDFVSAQKARFSKEIYVKGNAALGTENTLRAIACDSRLFIAGKVTISRWADAEGNIDICRGCNLGISISSVKTLKISKNCRFKRLYGLPVLTVDDIPIMGFHDTENMADRPPEQNFENDVETRSISDLAWVVHEKYSMIPESTLIEKDYITRKNLKIRRNCRLLGNIKTHGSLIIGKDVEVSGNIFADGDIEIGDGSVISGNIFSQGSVHILERVEIGASGKYKSVIGKKGIVLEQNVTIYGYVMTEGIGMIT